MLEKLFSPKQIAALRRLTDRHTEDVLYGGAAGGGKTYLGCSWQISNRLEFPGTRGFIGRESKLDLRLTTLMTFEEVWAKTWHRFGIRFDYNWRDHIVEFSNGSIIYLHDLRHYPRDPDYQALGSLELTDGYVDEAGQITEKAFHILGTRIRYNLINGVPKLLLTSNPHRGWLKHTYVKDSEGNPIKHDKIRAYITAKLGDNPNKAWAERYARSLGRLPQYDRDRLLEGDWDATERKLPFFCDFSKQSHTGQVLPRRGQPGKISTTYPIWLSFDFNNFPTTCIIGQKEYCTVLKEIQVNGGTEALCNEIIRLGYNRWPGGLIVTGDSSGTHGNTAAGMEPDGRHVTDFGIIQKKFRIPDHRFIQAFEANKRIAYSRTLCNYAFRHLPFLVDDECQGLITDLETAQETPDGGLLKNREAHKQDLGDALRYLVNAWFPDGLDDIDKWAMRYNSYA